LGDLPGLIRRLQGIRAEKGKFLGGNGRKKYFCIDLRILKKIHPWAERFL
jgi:hypothetical protein